MSMHGILRATFLIGNLFSLTGKPVASQQTTVFAAASLTNAFTEIGAELERKNPQLSIRFNFAGSQQLVTQMEQGARADVFASADERWMTYAVEHSLIDGPPRIFAHNHLVVIIPKTNPARIGTLHDLARVGTKLVLAADVVPAGKYSRDLLTNLSRLPEYGTDFSNRALANVVSNEETVKGVVAKVALGEADAGIVYRTDMTPDVTRLVTVLEIPDAQNVLATYPVGVARGAPTADAKAFITFLLSAEGQRILARHGFLPAKGNP
jgi:molybdate transport system substrate-binding protein